MEKREEMKIIDDLKRDINNKFNNLEGINELDNCMKQLDYMLTKSKQKSLQNRSNNGEQNENFYRSEKKTFLIIIIMPVILIMMRLIIMK